MNDFLSNLDWAFIVKMAGFAVALFGGVKSVPIINKLKSMLKWSGRKAQFIVVVVSVVLAVATNILSGAISPTPLDPEYVMGLFTLILLTSQSEYVRIKKLLGE